MASFLQYALPGAPSLYYGDEAGLEGHADPFNRRTYPWGREDTALLDHFRRLGALRKAQEPLRLGDIQFFQASEQKLGFTRNLGKKQLRVYINRSHAPWKIPAGKVLLGHRLENIAPAEVSLAPMGYCITEDE